MRTTSGLIDQRRAAHDTTEDQLDALLLQAYQLNKPMEVFRLLDQPLYEGYKKARRVGRPVTGQ